MPDDDLSVGTGQLDPTKGVFRWAWSKTRSNLGTVSVGLVAAGVVGALFVPLVPPLPAHPSGLQRVENAIVTGVGVALILGIGVYLVAVVVAPFQQRNQLRTRVSDLEDEGGDRALLTTLSRLLGEGESHLGWLAQMAWLVDPPPHPSSTQQMAEFHAHFTDVNGKVSAWHDELDEILRRQGLGYEIALSESWAEPLTRDEPPMRSYQYAWERLARRLQWLHRRVDRLSRELIEG